ncbi:response regulator, partial [bacterium]
MHAYEDNETLGPGTNTPGATARHSNVRCKGGLNNVQNQLDPGAAHWAQRTEEISRITRVGERDRDAREVRAAGGAEDGDEAPEAGATASVRPRRRARVLLIDDEPALARTLKLLLSELHDVTAVTTGKEALEILLGGAVFDLVLCDLMMPQVTGMDIHAKLAVERPDMVERLVFMTGGAFTARASDFLKRVSNVRLEKPFSTELV